MTNSAASLKAGRFPGWKVMHWSTIPRPTAAAVMLAKRSIRPMTTAARAWTRIVAGRTLPIGIPTEPARRNMARKASTLAIAHTTVWRRFTGTPSIAARSARSAAPRIATPTLERRRNSASATSAAGTRIRVRTSFALKRVGATVKLSSNGGAMRSPKPSPRKRRGRNSAAPVRSWDRPMVATMRIRRGARKNRRITRISTRIPSTTAAARPVRNET